MCTFKNVEYFKNLEKKIEKMSGNPVIIKAVYLKNKVIYIFFNLNFFLSHNNI